MSKYYILATSLLVLTASLSSGAFTVLYLYDPKFNLTNSLFGFSSTLLSALLGGFIAYYASRKQIAANSINSLLIELKKESASCLVAKNELNTIYKRIEKTIGISTKYNSLSPFIEIDYLEIFRKEHLYLFNISAIELFLKVLNRLKLIKINNTDSILEENQKTNLLNDIKQLLENYEQLSKDLDELKKNNQKKIQ